MAPRRGGGGPSIGGSGGGDGDSDIYSNPYFYDPGAIYSPSDLNALRAEIACAATVILTALIVIWMVIRKSWLNHDGRRKKSRLLAFLTCLVSVLVSQASLIAGDSFELQRPNNLDDVQNGAFYHNVGLRVLLGISGFFDVVASTSVLGLIAIEITRRDKGVEHKHKTFETLCFLTIFALFALAIALWVIGMIEVSLVVNGTFVDPGDIPLDLGLTYHIVALFLVTLMAVATPYKKKDLRISETHGSRIRAVTRAMWTLLALALSSFCVGAYLHNPLNTTLRVSLGASADLMWVPILFYLALLARLSYNSQRTDPTYVGIEQNGPTEGHAYDVFLTGQSSDHTRAHTEVSQHHATSGPDAEKGPNVWVNPYSAQAARYA